MVDFNEAPLIEGSNAIHSFYLVDPLVLFDGAGYSVGYVPMSCIWIFLRDLGYHGSVSLHSGSLYSVHRKCLKAIHWALARHIRQR